MTGESLAMTGESLAMADCAKWVRGSIIGAGPDRAQPRTMRSCVAYIVADSKRQRCRVGAGPRWLPASTRMVSPVTCSAPSSSQTTGSDTVSGVPADPSGADAA